MKRQVLINTMTIILMEVLGTIMVRVKRQRLLTATYSREPILQVRDPASSRCGTRQAELRQAEQELVVVDKTMTISRDR